MTATQKLSSRPPVSIVIPTVGRTVELWNTLRDLLPQLQAGDEFVMVDQNTPGLQPPPYLASAPLRLLSLSPPSLTRARNMGLKAARHDRVIFLDDDIEPWPDLLDRFSAVANQYPHHAITGLVQQEDRVELPPCPPGALGGSIGFIDFRSGQICTDITRATLGESAFFSGGLFLIHKSELPSDLDFCRDFRGAAQGEEIDFALRLREAGIRVYCDPSIGIRHLKVPSGGCRSEAFKRRFFLDEVYNRALFYGRHGHWRYLPRFLIRTRSFCEFHSRRPRGGHSGFILLRALWSLKLGFWRGALWRTRNTLLSITHLSINKT